MYAETMEATEFNGNGLFICGGGKPAVSMVGKNILFPDYMAHSGNEEIEEVLIHAAVKFRFCPMCNANAPKNDFHIFKTFQYTVTIAHCCNDVFLDADDVFFWGKEFVE